MHRKVLISLFWSRKSQLIIGIREPGTRRIPRLAIPSLMGTILQGLSMVSRARAVDSTLPQLWHSKQQAGAAVLSGAVGDRLETGMAMVLPGTGPLGMVWVPGKAEQGCKNLFLSSGAWLYCIFSCSSTQFLWILHSAQLLSWCTSVPSQSFWSFQSSCTFFTLCRTLSSLQCSSQPLENQLLSFKVDLSCTWHQSFYFFFILLW